MALDLYAPPNNACASEGCRLSFIGRARDLIQFRNSEETKVLGLVALGLGERDRIDDKTAFIIKRSQTDVAGFKGLSSRSAV